MSVKWSILESAVSCVLAASGAAPLITTGIVIERLTRRAQLILEGNIVNAIAAAKEIIQQLDEADFVIAPKEPTEEMILAAPDSTTKGYLSDKDIRGIYKAMIEARPK